MIDGSDEVVVMSTNSEPFFVRRVRKEALGNKVVDGLNTICSVGHTGTIKSIKKCIYGNPHLVIFNYCFSHMSIPMIRYLLTVSICRLSLNNSITGLSSCIIRSLKVCTSEDKVVKVCSLIQTPKVVTS